MKKIVLYITALLVFIVAAGAVYQFSVENTDRKYIPGELVNLNGKQIHFYCVGEGKPTVILENGTWGSYPDWMDIMDGAKDTTRICSYDRLGIGWSSLNGGPTSAKKITDTLKSVLTKKGITHKIILVGFSAGGLYVRKYAETYPNDVAGVVLVDSAHEQQVVRNAYRPNKTQVVNLCSALSWTGLVRILGLMDSDVPSTFDSERGLAQKRVYYRSQFCSGLLEQSAGFPREFTGKPPKSLGSLPLTVISSGKTLREQGFGALFSSEFLDSHEKTWPILQKELASLSTDSEFVVAGNSGHAIAIEQPEVVIEAILTMVRRVRSAE